MILSQAQAEAVYSAMRALNNVGGRIHVSLPDQDRRIIVREFDFGEISVWGANGEDEFDMHSTIEGHANQSAFAAAYGLL